MPCQDGGPSREQEVLEKLQLSVITRLACDRCRYLEKHGGVPKWALSWWAQHQEEDAERIAESARARREAAVRKRALAKLTAEEREELGL